MDDSLSAKELYNYLKYELKAHRANNFGTLVLDTVDDDESPEPVPYVSWRYEPENSTALDAAIYYDENEWLRIDIGPVEQYNFAFSSAHELKEQLLKTILMILNGQLMLVVTYPLLGGLGRYQAAELYLNGLEKQPTVLRVISNHTRSAKKLEATILANNVAIDHQIITPSFWFLPEKTNGKYPKGREVDFTAPTPLTRNAYKKLDESLTIQGLGAEPDKPFWSYFYRTTEFWIVTIPIVAFDIWLTETFLKDDTWMNAILKLCINLLTLIMAVFLTSLLLARRQAKLDKERVPKFERLEDVITVLGISKVFAVAAVMVLLFAPMWTPAGDFVNLFPGTKYVSTYPLLMASYLLLFAPLLFSKTGPKTSKLILSIIYTGGIAGIFATNSLYMNTADNSPEIATQWIILGLFVPVMLNIWMYYKTFAKPNPRDKKGWA